MKSKVKRLTATNTKRLMRTETPGARLRKEKIFEFNALLDIKPEVPYVEVVSEEPLNETEQATPAGDAKGGAQA